MPVSRHRRGRGRSSQRASRDLSITRPRKRKVNKLYLAASALIAIGVIGGFAVGSINFGRGTSVATGSSSQYVEGVGVAHGIMPGTYPNPHVPVGLNVTYSTTPPTTGKHLDRWAQCDFYAEGISPDEATDERTTHNLEHGNIIVSFNLPEPVDVARLRGTLEQMDLYLDWGLARFYDKIPEGQVALAAWGVVDTMEGIDAARMERFFKTYAGKLGPEEISCARQPHQMPR